MARDESGPFVRGGSWYEGSPIDTNNLGGKNIEGKEFLLEVNGPNAALTQQTDPSGRYVRVRVVRNASGVYLKPRRLVKYADSAADPLCTKIAGYCTAVADRPAGVVDEFLPASGVAPNELFYIVVDGPTQFLQAATTAANLIPGDRLVAAPYGATAGDDLGGRVAKQDLSGATAVLGNQLQNFVGICGATNSTAGNTLTNCIVTRFRW